MDIASNIREIKGIGEKTALLFERAGVSSVRDLLNYYPRSYEVYEKPITVREARYRDRASIFAVIQSMPATRYVKNLKITEVMISDETGAMMKAVWFNMPYLQKTLKMGSSYVFSGKIEGASGIRRLT